MKIVLKFIIILIFINSGNCFSQGKINQSKKELKSIPPNNNLSSKDNTDTNSSRNSINDPLSNEIGKFIFEGIKYITFYSLIGKYNTEYHLKNNLTNYPYESELSGNFRDLDSSSAKINILRIDLEEQILLNTNNLYGNHFKAKIRPFQYFYIQTDYFKLIEFNIKNYSDLSLLSVNFCYDRIRFERFNLGWSLGINYIGNEINKAGLNYGFNTEIFIFKPYSIYSSIKWSSINNIPIDNFELKWRFHKKNYLLSIGYEHLKIGSPNYNFLSIGAGIFLL